MDLRAFRAGANILAYVKNDRKYGMCCAWATMLDYDQIGLLLGSQSATGRMLQMGDIVGVSALAEGQGDIALRFGNGHSDQANKFEGFDAIQNETAILIPSAKVRMVCRVLGFWFPEDGAADRLVRLRVLSYESDDSVAFLDGYSL